MLKHTVLMAHTSHLDLFWFAAMPECLEIGRECIKDAIIYCKEDPEFHFVIEAARFAEYFIM